MAPMPAMPGGRYLTGVCALRPPPPPPVSTLGWLDSGQASLLNTYGSAGLPSASAISASSSSTLGKPLMRRNDDADDFLERGVRCSRGVRLVRLPSLDAPREREVLRPLVGDVAALSERARAAAAALVVLPGWELVVPSGSTYMTSRSRL